MTQYHFDFVFCFETSASMASRLGFAKEFAKKLVFENPRSMGAVGKLVAKQRARIVAFGDLGTNPGAFRATSFAEVGPDVKESKFDECLDAVSVEGKLRGNPQSALEALSVAIRSDWTHEGDRQRHVIVVFADSNAHRLESRVGEVPWGLRSPANFNELTSLWDCVQSVRLKETARRLVIFGPDAYPWNVIGDSWGNTL